MINPKPNFGILIFKALDYLRRNANDIALDAPITVLEERHSTALKQLRSITGFSKLNNQKTVSDFTREAQHWFESITGSYSAPTGPFVLTIDNLVRILAIGL
jgi:hypothetical protein